jgi:hypothetical protein
MDIEGIKAKLKQEWEERPIIMIMAGTALVNSVIHVVKMTNETRNSHAWSKEVKRRNKMTR